MLSPSIYAQIPHLVGSNDPTLCLEISEHLKETVLRLASRRSVLISQPQGNPLSNNPGKLLSGGVIAVLILSPNGDERIITRASLEPTIKL